MSPCTARRVDGMGNLLKKVTITCIVTPRRITGCRHGSRNRTQIAHCPGAACQAEAASVAQGTSSYAPRRAPPAQHLLRHTETRIAQIRNGVALAPCRAAMAANLEGRRFGEGRFAPARRMGNAGEPRGAGF